MTEPEITADMVEATAVRILALRDHSRAELIGKLKKRDYPTNLIDVVIEKCEEYGWLDDVRFAERQAEILRDRGWGPVKIVKKLVAHGVTPSMARTASESLDEDWDVRCRERLESKFGEDLDSDERAKAVRHLKSRGFWESTIRRVILDGSGTS